MIRISLGANCVLLSLYLGKGSVSISSITLIGYLETATWSLPLDPLLGSSPLYWTWFASQERQIRMCCVTPGLLQGAHWGERKHISIHLNCRFQANSWLQMTIRKIDFKHQLFSSIATIPILVPHQEQQNKQGTNHCYFLLLLAQPNPGNRVSLGTGPPCETARPRSCGCGWKNWSLPCTGFSEQLVLFLHQYWSGLSFYLPHSRKTLRKKNLSTWFISLLKKALPLLHFPCSTKPDARS